ncbi:MAG TPA: hypothetical protein VN213_18515 [Solirubrobacteraceae bacterium]|nr:hypothetical protein [Solirubrobacteraceae bacterium]
MDLLDLIAAFNESATPPIELRPTRDGRVGAILPRTGREILVKGSMFKAEVRVREADMAALCEEARLAVAPGVALMGGALDMLREVAAAEEQQER